MIGMLKRKRALLVLAVGLAIGGAGLPGFRVLAEPHWPISATHGGLVTTQELANDRVNTEALLLTDRHDVTVAELEARWRDLANAEPTQAYESLGVLARVSATPEKAKGDATLTFDAALVVHERFNDGGERIQCSSIIGADGADWQIYGRS